VKIAFVAARRPQQTRNKNILSAVHGQSKAEAIQNRPAIRKDAEKKINPTIKGVHHDFWYYGRNAR
jgi:hypothetical protein